MPQEKALIPTLADSAHGQQVLIVEDNLAFGELLAGALKDEGYRCQTVTSGASGLVWLSTHGVNLVIVEHALTDMSGVTFITAMVAQGVTAPFIVIASQDDSALAVQMIKQGASDFVVKDTTLLDRLPMVVTRTFQEAEVAHRLQLAEAALRQSEARLARAQQVARIGGWEWNLRSNGVYLSNGLLLILGYDPADPPPVSMEWIMGRINPADVPMVRMAMAKAVETGEPLNVVYRITTGSGGEIVVSSQGEVEYGEDGKPMLLIGATLDITARSKAEEAIQQLANYDILTGLPNRNLLFDRLQQAIIQAVRNHQRVGVLFVDLDRFKGVNDSLGHRVGDKLLRAVAARLRACVRESDTLARQGGDEFIVVLSGVDHEEGISAASNKILTLVAEPFVIEGHELYLTASVGVAVYPEDGEDAASLLKHADLAMYQAKELDRNNFQFFSKDMNVKVMERMVLESSLRRALERNEFELLYQPQVDVKTRQIVGFEALIRWHHPDLGMIAPDKFIPLAEETGLIIPIGEWVIRTAVHQAKVWQAVGLPKVKVAVNLSGRQFKVQLDQVVAAILQEAEFDACWLELEITESILMHNAANNMALLHALTDMGCSLSIDDFGTGYSSLAYLKNFPVGRLKIDRSFVRDITNNADDMAIAKIIIDMANTLRMQVTAEGVEEPAQLEMLAAHGCSEMQGYLFSKPVVSDKIPEMFKQEFRF